MLFVAGLCTSVAHLAELEQFLEATRSIPNIAFALVLQNREALDVEGFTTRVTAATGHPVEAISDDQPVQAGHIYLAPEGTKVTLEGRRFKTEPAEGEVGQRGETDSFLVSLADEMRESAIGVIFSGTGSDGTLGFVALKENGGLTLAEDSSAPPGFIATEVLGRSPVAIADYVLPAAELPIVIKRHLEAATARAGAQRSEDVVRQSEAAARDRGWLDPIHPDDRERVLNAWSNAQGDGILIVDHRLWNQEEGGYRNVRMRAVRMKDDNGSTVEWLGIITDVHELLRLQQRQNDLLAELQHRVRNTLAVVRSIVRRSAETSGSVEEYASHLDGRINALARIQNVLTRSPEATLDLQGLILDELASQGGGEAEKFTVSGPDILLSGSAAGTLSLAFHELATNAVKYGALATPGGSIEVTWDIKPNTGRPLLDIRWREILPRNSTPVPVRRGFGSELIEKVIPYELGGRTSLDLSPTGIVCSIVLPLHNEIRLGNTGPEQDAEGA